MAKVDQEERQKLENVTGYGMESQIDEKNLNNALGNIQAKKVTKNSAIIKIKQEDIDFLVRELCIDKIQANTLLKKNDGDLVRVLAQYINQ